ESVQIPYWYSRKSTTSSTGFSGCLHPKPMDKKVKAPTKASQLEMVLKYLQVIINGYIQVRLHSMLQT
ncbi:MAG: hypothetical protein AB7V54_05690, partial [Parabacteroides sp.]|uniref:hypothetical protein n=1 Tax=Macellibacteroides sp. TaxID=2014584 RepID=UPI003E269321